MLWLLQWCKGRKRKHKLAWGLQNKPEKKSRYLDNMQQVRQCCPSHHDVCAVSNPVIGCPASLQQLFGRGHLY